MEALVIVSIAGCTPKIVGSDAGVYQAGTMYAVSSKDMDAVYQATLQAMDKFELKVSDKMKDVFGAKVVAKSADGKMIVIEIKPTMNNETKYLIKIGPLGDEERSRKIYMEINNALMGKK
jgi:hypothetical protein